MDSGGLVQSPATPVLKVQLSARASAWAWRLGLLCILCSALTALGAILFYGLRVQTVTNVGPYVSDDVSSATAEIAVDFPIFVSMDPVTDIDPDFFLHNPACANPATTIRVENLDLIVSGVYVKNYVYCDDRFDALFDCDRFNSSW
jgi:hypothetical protein